MSYIDESIKNKKVKVNDVSEKIQEIQHTNNVLDKMFTKYPITVVNTTNVSTLIKDIVYELGEVNSEDMVQNSDSDVLKDTKLELDKNSQDDSISNRNFSVVSNKINIYYHDGSDLILLNSNIISILMYSGMLTLTGETELENSSILMYSGMLTLTGETKLENSSTLMPTAISNNVGLPLLLKTFGSPMIDSNFILGEGAIPSLFILTSFDNSPESYNKLTQFASWNSDELHANNTRVIIIGDYSTLPSYTNKLIGIKDHIYNPKLSQLYGESLFGQIPKDFGNIYSGFSLTELNTVRKQYNEDLKPENINNALLNLRIQNAKNNKVLEIIEPKMSIDDLGGHDLAKEWITTAIKAQNYAKNKKETIPIKGILLCGVPGTGKSALAHVFASVVGKNTKVIRLDLASGLDSFIGNSESNIKTALTEVTNIGNQTILLIDEVEKLLGGAKSSNATDGGLTQRLLSIILTFLEENTNVIPVFTANNVGDIPPELTRKGRIDEIMFSDIPTDEERFDIFKIYLQKYGITYKKTDINKLVKVSKNFTGAEIEAVVQDGKRKAYAKELEPTPMHVYSVILKTLPIYEFRKEDITFMRNWALQHAKATSSKSEVQKKYEAMVTNINKE